MKLRITVAAALLAGLSTALVVTPGAAATDVGNGAPAAEDAELALKCTFHRTEECITIFGEGLPLPWPFPWSKKPDQS
jgi:hypothetical protein